MNAIEDSRLNSTFAIQLSNPLRDFIDARYQEIRSLKIRQEVSFFIWTVRQLLVKFFERFDLMSGKNSPQFRVEHVQLVNEKRFDPLLYKLALGERKRGSYIFDDRINVHDENLNSFDTKIHKNSRKINNAKVLNGEFITSASGERFKQE